MKIINLILFLLITVQINAQDYFLKNNGPYNDKIMSPEEFLGYEIGFEHTRHDLIISYLNYLSNSSDNAQIIEYGRTHEGRKLVMLTVSSSSNLNNIGEIQRIHLKYTNPENKDKIDNNLPIIINLGYGVHGNEPSSSEAAMLTAYTMVASESNKIKKFRDRSIIFICLLYTSPSPRD